MTIREIDSVLTKIAVMDRLALLQKIQTFSAPYRLDFTDEYLAAQDTERLRHILMAAFLQQKSRAFELEPVG
jgi:hypothetical protein